MKTTKLEKKTVVRNFLLPILPIQSLDNGLSLTLVSKNEMYVVRNVVLEFISPFILQTINTMKIGM